MSTPKWAFIVLSIWILATIFCNALEPSKTELMPSDMTSTLDTMGAERGEMAGAGAMEKAFQWGENVLKALTFDYGILEEGYMVIVRYILIIFSIAGLYFLGDFIIMFFRVGYAAFGKFQG